MDIFLWPEATFALMLALALALSKSRLGWPLKWAETFYHEFSHGMVCVLTGGKIHRIELEWNGAGCCTTAGGWRIPTLLAGYAGASIWGGFLYMAGWLATTGGATLWLKIELGILAFVFLFWARDLKTCAILLIIGATYALAITRVSGVLIPTFLQFTGIYVMLNAIRAPLFLIDGQHVGDGAALADIFHILPEGVWIALWFAFAILIILACMVATLPSINAVAAPLLQAHLGFSF